MDTNGKFYLGRIFDPKVGRVTDSPLQYDPADLTTHAVVVGMTGSGKTGLCLDLLEEAALQGIPALMIDPKGDITNALLHFPDLLPEDFQPWMNPDQARRDGKTIEQAAAEAADKARKGLAEWGMTPERVLSLKNAAHFAVYTPGSDSGISVSILATLECPPIPWEGNREILREKISGTVTAILGLVGLDDIDPVRSREHILLANIFEHAWSRGQDLDLGELILQTQTPPFPKLGVFDVNTFFPEKDRFELAMLLNNILAAPTFQAWIEGQPLDIPSLLYAEDGRPRHSVFYIAHLADAERMFFVTLLFSAVETWMRSQTGTSGLRAIVYFDEIFGYLPPTRNPPSKQPMLRMLKQARAFGVGQVLATQNPVDVDYKALSNAGTWFIGKLQTDQDKQRLLDGLDSAMSGSLDRAAYDKLISSLDKRVFLMHNIHTKSSQLFQTRFAMNYLAGPITRTQIPALNQLAGVVPLPMGEKVNAPASAPLDQLQPVSLKQPKPSSASIPSPLSPVVSTTRPTLPPGIREYFLPNNLTFTEAFKAAGREFPYEAYSEGLIYHPVFLGQVTIRFLNRKYNLDTESHKTVIVANPDRRGVVRWENFIDQPVHPAALDEAPDPQARFAVLEAPFTETKTVAALQKDFLEWAYRAGQMTVRANEVLKLYGGPEISSAEFRKMCADAARKGRDAEAKKVTISFDSKLRTLHDRLEREERELSQDKTEVNQREREEGATHVENILGGLFGTRRSNRRLSSSMTKHRLTEQAKADVEESVDAIDEYQKQVDLLEAEKARSLQEINSRWGSAANQITEIPIAPLKKDILLDLFGVAWMPYHLVRVGEDTEELPGYGVK